MAANKLNRIAYNPYDQLSKTSIAFRTVLESIPFGLGPFGIGDLISLFEAVSGSMIFGPKLDKIDRIISLVAAFVPLLPATPVRLFVFKLRHSLQRH